MTAVTAVKEIAYEGSIRDLAYRGPVLKHSAELSSVANFRRCLRWRASEA
jgi:hypothetical protein